MLLHQAPPQGYKPVVLKYGPYSPSRLIVARCPQRFFGQYVRGDTSVAASVAAARGSAIHTVFEKITKAHLSGAVILPAELDKWVADAIGEYPAAYTQVDLVKEAALAYIGNPPLRYITQHTKCEEPLAVAMYEEDTFMDEFTSPKVFVPVPYRVDDRPNKLAYFGGVLDMLIVDPVVQTVTILDHKSTPSANKDEDHDFQLGAYAWLVSLFYPGYRVRSVIHYAHPRLNFYGAPTEYDAQDLHELGDYVTRRIHAIESFAEFPAIPGNQCDYCHMAQECEIYTRLCAQKARGSVDLNVRGVDDLIRLAKDLHVVETLRSELNQALKKGIETHCKEAGIDIGGVWYGFKRSEESVDWLATDVRIRDEAIRAQKLLDMQQYASEEERAELQRRVELCTLDKLLIAHGLEPQTYKSWQGQKLKNIWRLDKAAFLEELSKFIVKDRGTTFGARKS